ncbi:MAG: hypothetical protein U0271_05285 [Polyangiaceae bacterium]
MKLTAKRTCMAGAVALVVLPSVGVAATTVKGKVVNTQDLLNPVWNEAKDPASHRYTFREPSPSVPAEFRVLRGHISKELCVVAMSDDQAKPLNKPIRIVIEGGRTSFVTFVVAPGQELVFENHDPTAHSLYGVDPASGLTKTVQAADSGTPSTRTWTPPGPGKWEIRDELSPSLRSWIVVDPKLAKEGDSSKGIATTFPNRKGEFEVLLDLDPAKKYTLQAFYNGEAVGTALPIEIKPVNNAAPATIDLPAPLKAGEDKTPAPDPTKKDEPKKDEPKKGGS